jgi:hypothetical protein
MIRHSTKAKVFDKLIESLEHAEAGGRDLDVLIAFILGDTASESGQLIQLLVEEGYAWDVVSELLDTDLPTYTRSLDRVLPGENIVLSLRSAKRSKWAAVHESPRGERFLAWASDECLARRLAALKGLRAGGFAEPRRPEPPAARDIAAQFGLPPRPEAATADADKAPPQEEPAEEEWKILF